MCLSKNGMALRNEKKNLRKESWQRTSGTTKWDKLGQVGVVGQVAQGAGGIQILVGQVEQGEGGLQIFVGQVDKDKGPVHLNHSTCPKRDYKTVKSFIKFRTSEQIRPSPQVSVGSEIVRIPLNPQRPSRAGRTENHSWVKYSVPFVDLTFLIFRILWPLMINQKV